MVVKVVVKEMMEMMMVKFKVAKVVVKEIGSGGQCARVGEDSGNKRIITLQITVIVTE